MCKRRAERPKQDILTPSDPSSSELQKIEAAIQMQENLRGLIPDEQIEGILATLRAQHAAYLARADQGSAVAQGTGATAIAEKAVGVKGPVTHSTINTGVIYHLYQTAPGRGKLSETDFTRILKDYIQWVLNAYGKARLYGLESVQTSRERPNRQLADVFVPLSLRRFSPPSRREIEGLLEKRETEPLAHHKAYLRLVDEKRTEGQAVDLANLLTLSPRLAVIGGAGSGKSTLAAYLAASLAQGPPYPFTLPKGRESLVPLIVPLRYYREYQFLVKANSHIRLSHPRAGTLAGFIPWYLTQRIPALELSEDFLDRLLLGGGCLLILDGLDEVVSQTDRGQVREQVERLANDIYPGNQFLVTAREVGYRENAVFGDDFVRLDVQPLDDSQIETLVHNWCAQLYPEQVATQTQETTQAIQNINTRYRSQEQPPLIATPLMTTMVVSVKWGETELPRERARLYEAAVKVILQAQYVPDDQARQELVNWGGAWEEQREWLSHLALEMHRSGKDGAAIGEARLREILAPRLTPTALETFIQAVRLRGGLFEERGELFQFAHLTFQEFLAARLLAKQRKESLNTLAKHLTAPWWREVLLLLYGFAKMDYAPFAGEYLAWLSSRDGSDETHLAGLELAAAAVLEIERPDPALREAQARQLVAGITNPTAKTSALLRVQGGNTLAGLGDVRFREDLWHLPDEPLFGFVEIPAGPFVMGSDKRLDSQAYDDELPQHELTLPTYWLARYPVTVAQWRAFIGEAQYKPDRKDSVLGYANHPVVYVTWHDALKYCAWLQGKLKEKAKQPIIAQSPPQQKIWAGLASGQLHVTLPSEAEWEKAARGPKPTAPIYPWGHDFDPEKANIDATQINTTSAVGCFPGGGSFYGLLDMSGNVWEWTRSILGKFDEKKSEHVDLFRYPYRANDGRENLQADNDSYRVLRGGSFYDPQNRARCAFRFQYYPRLRYWHYGFRVVVSLSS